MNSKIVLLVVLCFMIALLHVDASSSSKSTKSMKDKDVKWNKKLNKFDKQKSNKKISDNEYQSRVCKIADKCTYKASQKSTEPSETCKKLQDRCLETSSEPELGCVSQFEGCVFDSDCCTNNCAGSICV